MIYLLMIKHMAITVSRLRSRKQVDQFMNNFFLKKIIGNYPFISIKIF